MFEARLPQSLWVEALFTANFLSNLLPHTVLGKVISPFEKLNGTAPQYSALRVLGCACYPYLRPYTQNKFDPKSLLCVFLGYTEKQKGYRCLHPPTGRVYISRHVLFDEAKFPFSDVYKSCMPQANTPLLSVWYKGLNISQEEEDQTTEKSDEQVVNGQRHQATAPLPQQPQEDNVPFRINEADFPPLPPPAPILQPVSDPQPEQPSTDNAHNMVTRGKAGIRKPNPRYVLHTVKSEVAKPKESW